MNANPSTIAQVFEGQKQYVIPVFQRTYEWGQNRWESIWQDILAISEENDPNLTHFIGPMVTIPNAIPIEVPKYLVIDGQQRLMTLTIILAALRDRAKRLGLMPIANSIDTNTLLFINTKGENIEKLVPRIRDRDAVHNILLGNSSQIDQNLLIAQAYAFFLDAIEQLTPLQQGLFEERNDVVIDRLYNAIIQRLKVVMITIDNSDNPSNIYESLNFKSEKLSDADLIRNYIFMKLGPVEEQEKFDNAHWKAFEEMFSYADPEKRNDILTDFYYRFLIFKTEYLARKMLYVHFTKYIDNFLKDHNRVELVNDLAKFARFFISITNKCSEPDLEEAFVRFRQLGTDTAIPLVLAMHHRYDKNEINKTNFIKMLRLTESFILRRFIVRSRSRGYGLDFSVARDHIASLGTLKKYFIEKGLPLDEKIKEELLTFEFYSRNSEYCRLVLSEIEKMFGHKEKIDLSDKAVQIEHIMPQDLTQSWRDMLGDNANEKHETYLHTLGNLTLTGYNPELSNRPFAEKKSEYKNSNFQLNKHFAKQTKWTDTEIIERTKELANRFIDIWEGPDAQIKTSNKSTRISRTKANHDDSRTNLI
jgi:uncharacterized protein with ParB-like and HNH nuclease domain